MIGGIFILNIFKVIKSFIQKYKSYIIISFILILSLVSIVIQNIQEKSQVVINEQKIEKNKYDGKIAVYIAGEVVNPGVYYIDEGSRLNDVIDICGGFTEYADISELNLAEMLNDSDKDDIPRLEVEKEIKESESDSEIQEENNNNLVNINKATKEELKSLNGIGDILADNIINYRKTNKFNSIEDILNVDGIGESKFNSIKEYICVN